ncbi:hypothetical protein Glove_174g181 [Diversispora epigaea]|uniref:Uncharacterized protein n=1 Tax=Diversispora epigaea TaxID=1348612 RepID=A0A397IYD7_9GLOM|nr:hypothetical protein Glove_174g181 [Diversispora epigaea]
MKQTFVHHHFFHNSCVVSSYVRPVSQAISYLHLTPYLSNDDLLDQVVHILQVSLKIKLPHQKGANKTLAENLALPSRKDRPESFKGVRSVIADSRNAQRIAVNGQPLPTSRTPETHSDFIDETSDVYLRSIQEDYNQQSALEQHEQEKDERGYKINRDAQPGTGDKVIENVENLDSPTINKEVEEGRIFPAEIATQKQDHQEGAKVNLAEDSLPG